MRNISPPSSGPKILLPTGHAYAFGHFGLRLNFPWAKFQGLGERFYLLVHPTDFLAPSEGFEIDLNSINSLPPENWVTATDKPPPFLGSPFKLLLNFTKAKDGNYPASSVFSWALSPRWNSGYRFSLAFERQIYPGRGLIIFKNLALEEVLRWNRDTWKTVGVKKPTRFIHSAGPWQPEKPWVEDGFVTLWRIPEPLPYLDAHLHIQSHLCAPLPLVWDKMPAIGEIFKLLRVGWRPENDPNENTKGIIENFLKSNPEAAFGLGGYLIAKLRPGDFPIGLESVVKVIFGESGAIGFGSTADVGEKLGRELSSAHSWEVPFFSGAGSVHALSTPLPMDMHFGHFRGYFGEPIYKDENKKFSFALDPFSGKRGEISRSDKNFYEHYDMQIDLTNFASIKSPWQMLPLYHYDPRRWRGDGKTGKSWNTPFDFVNTKSRPAKIGGPFIGFKTYTSLGYMPLDPRLSKWQKLFYARCMNEGIPIMNHCTTAGMYTHDKPFYYDLWKHHPETGAKMPISPHVESLEEELLRHVKKTPNMPDYRWIDLETRLWAAKTQWFDENYVYPGAWKDVIKNFPKLRLCLAHLCGYDYWGKKGKPNGSHDERSGMVFGFPKTKPGEMPDEKFTNPLIYQLCDLMLKQINGSPVNVYADLSFFFFTEHNQEAIGNFFAWAKEHRDGFLLDRLLWGTDWPLPVTDSAHGLKNLRSDMMKHYVGMNAKALCEIDPELWLRLTMVNPARFYELQNLLPHLEKTLGKAPPPFRNIPKSLEDFHGSREKVMG